MNNTLYTEQGDPPRLIPSFVCYADILGYTTLTENAFRYGTENELLGKLKKALSTAYETVRRHANILNDFQSFSVKVYTDNIVLGYPIEQGISEDGEHELGHILEIFSAFQSQLAVEGFFIRGGITYGNLYMDEDVVFGDALLEAVRLDKEGGSPRLSLSPMVMEIVNAHIRYYNPPDFAPYYREILIDIDNTYFLNYLDEAFCLFPDGPILIEMIDGHKRSIEKGLRDNSNNRKIREKYEWVAQYHNFVCRDFVDRHPAPLYPDGDEELAAQCCQLSSLLDFVIDIVPESDEPRHIGL